MATANVLTTVREMGRNGLGAPLLVVMMLAMVVIPMPPFALDIFFTFNISLALVILLVGIYSNRPLDFAIFPTVILIVTLLRLALNVASTRVVLLHGHAGGDAAGKVIEAFGNFVVGGNYAVGLVVFIILVIINFVVVTKGAGRVSEVSARFTLDAMPGKQMAIDADLNAGLINQDQARLRREEVSQEADFYGSMDGASKFVRGDAIAGILILVINIIGGLAIGTLQHDLSFTTALRNYTLLTIGDGLVAQIPALVLSTAAGIMVTRVSRAEDMGTQVVNQLLDKPKAWFITAAVIGSLGIVPGMPNISFLLISALCGGSGYLIMRRKALGEMVPEEELLQETEEVKPEMRELTWDDVQEVDVVGLEVGYRLIPLVDTNQGGQLMPRIKGVRKKLSQELGFLVPTIHIRDNLDLAPNAYRVTLKGVTVAEAEIQPDRDLAINPGQVFGSLEGLATRDPAFGLDATWIDPGQKEHAQTLGFTVVDPSTVIATHLSQLLQEHASDLLGHEEVQKLVDKLSVLAPKLVENLIPEPLSLGVLLKVLQNLLQESVPVRDIRTIAETLAEYAPRSQEPDVLTAFVRISLGRSIIQQIYGHEEELSVITLDPELEHILQQSLQGMAEGAIGLEPGLAERLQQSLEQTHQSLEASGQPSVLLVAAPIRQWLAQFTRRGLPNVKVLAYNEVPDSKKIKVVASIGQ